MKHEQAFKIVLKSLTSGSELVERSETPTEGAVILNRYIEAVRTGLGAGLLPASLLIALAHAALDAAAHAVVQSTATHPAVDALLAGMSKGGSA